MLGIDFKAFFSWYSFFIYLLFLHWLNWMPNFFFVAKFLQFIFIIHGAIMIDDVRVVFIGEFSIITTQREWERQLQTVFMIRFFGVIYRWHYCTFRLLWMLCYTKYCNIYSLCIPVNICHLKLSIKNIIKMNISFDNFEFLGIFPIALHIERIFFKPVFKIKLSFFNRIKIT